MTMDDTVAAAALAMWSRGLKKSAGSDRRERASGWLHSCRDGDAGGPGARGAARGFPEPVSVPARLSLTSV